MAIIDKFEIYYKLFNLNYKQIPTQKRKCHLSKEIKQKLQTTDKKYQAIINTIENKSLLGENLNSYLSTLLIKSNYDDLLYNLTLCYHLHIYPNQNKKSFLKLGAWFHPRSKDLLLIKIHNNEIYFLDILSHNEAFSKPIYLYNIIINNWSHILSPCIGVLSANPAISDEDIMGFIKKGEIERLNCPIQLNDGKFYLFETVLRNKKSWTLSRNVDRFLTFLFKNNFKIK